MRGRLIAFGLVLVFLATFVGPARAAEPYDVHVILPLTGYGAFLQEFIANLADFPGIDRIYNFKASPERGLGPDSAIAVTYDPTATSWVWLTKPGGVPLN